jgi:hypothetical protein
VINQNRQARQTAQAVKFHDPRFGTLPMRGRACIRQVNRSPIECGPARRPRLGEAVVRVGPVELVAHDRFSSNSSHPFASRVEFHSFGRKHGEFIGTKPRQARMRARVMSHTKPQVQAKSIGKWLSFVAAHADTASWSIS